jgi:hypothetical protein
VQQTNVEWASSRHCDAKSAAASWPYDDIKESFHLFMVLAGVDATGGRLEIKTLGAVAKELE